MDEGDESREITEEEFVVEESSENEGERTEQPVIFEDEVSDTEDLNDEEVLDDNEESEEVVSTGTSQEAVGEEVVDDKGLI